MPLFLHLMRKDRRVYVNADHISYFEAEHGGGGRTIIYFSVQDVPHSGMDYIIVDETIDEVAGLIPEVS